MAPGVDTDEMSARARVALQVVELRRRKGLTQMDLANLSGLHRTYISSIEQEERNLSIDNLDRLARALEVDVWRLLRAPLLGSRERS
jgi:transcriptional regulator with XRE-family HTH domain